jgi:hypothetical protein
MKNLLLYISLIAVILAGCTKKDDYVFGESPDERINKTLAKYNDVLTGAENGWNAFVYPAGLPTAPFAFYFKFDKQNRVQMFSDFDSVSATTYRESSWRLKSLQQPSLLFDTYSYIHVLCDPDASKNHGNYGVGLVSDFEFAIDGVFGDTVKLTGRLHGSKAILVKATSQEAQDYYENKRNWEFNSFSRFLTYFKQLNYGGTKYDIYVFPETRQLQILWIAGGEGKSFMTNFYYTPTGIAFTTPFNDGKQTIAGFEDVDWNFATQTMKVKIGGTDATITGVIKPLLIDASAGKRWRDLAANNGTYWISLQGFHVNGVDDAYGINKLSNFQIMLYYPNWNPNIDGALILTTGVFGPAFTPTFNVNGTTTFTQVGTIGTTPSAATTINTNITNKYTEQTGFYFVQTGTYSFDMVNVKDARSWITWIL